jgi:two-component system chemotaxis response regulator CheB
MALQKMLKVLVADDSRVSMELMVQIINRAPDMQVVGKAVTGREAVKMASELRPDIILMDMVLPEMNGLQAIQEIMYRCPVPIVAISAQIDASENDLALRAIKAGALTALPKPHGPGLPSFNGEKGVLLNTLRTMAGVHVIHHPLPVSSQRPGSQAGRKASSIVPDLPAVQAIPEIVGIVASTGGPAALSEVINGLPTNFPLPIVIVQHIAADFIPSLVEHLANSSQLPVSLAQADEEPLPGHVYLAPGCAHLRLSTFRRFHLDANPGTAQFMPSGSILLESIAKSYGSEAVGMILTGMGNDGTAGLIRMADAGAITIAQDEASSIVFGMPKSAIEANAVRQVLPLSEIAPALIWLCKWRKNS